MKEEDVLAIVNIRLPRLIAGDADITGGVKMGAKQLLFDDEARRKDFAWCGTIIHAQ